MNAIRYDPELPFLADLEQHVRAHAERALAPAPARARAARIAPRPRPWSPLAARIGRRTAILVGLLSLLGASAFGARAVFFDGAQNPIVVHQRAFALVASGHDAGDRWTLNLYARGGNLCRALLVAGQLESSRCAPAPNPRGLGVSSLASARHSYVFGVAGSRVRALRVHAGPTTLTVATRSLGDARARAAGLSSATRYFLAILARPPGHEDPPAIVTPLDAVHRPLGKPRVSCLREAGPPPCGP